MTTGRNDPCPCGSGKKYKKCCMDLDRAGGADGLVPSQARPRIAAAEEWEVDVVPLSGRIESDPASRPGVLLVLAAGFVLHNHVLERPSPEPEPLAAILATGLKAAGERAGIFPSRVRVRHPEVVEMLRQRLARELPDGPEPAPEIVAGPLPMLDDAAFALAESFSGHRHRFHLSCPNVWAGWDLPPELVEALFRAAAGFYRTTPWDVLGNLDAFEAATAAGRRWTVSVLGAAGEVFGLNLFSDSADLWRLSERDQETAFDDLAGQVIALHFLSGQEVGRAMVREAAAAGWEVADARGYPMLYTMSSPAGGLRRHDAEDLLAILGAIPRFLEHQARAVEESRPVGWWRDEPTGVELSYEPEGDVDIGPVWMPEHLDPGGAEGPGADPEAAVTEARRLAEDPDAFHDREQRFVGRFARHLAEGKGLAEPTVAKHASNADLFVEFLHSYQGVPLRAVHEYDLRTFLFDWYPRKVLAPREVSRAVPTSLRRFFAYLAAEEGIVCPWAHAILLDEREDFAERLESVPGRFFWEDGITEWRRAADDDLFALVMIPDSGLADGDLWGATMGATEATLRNELHRRWLLWREELIRAGTDGPFEVAAALVARQREWETAPHPELGGRSPVEAIHAERRARDRRLGRVGAKQPPKRGPKSGKKRRKR
jgi:hypothetical protein